MQMRGRGITCATPWNEIFKKNTHIPIGKMRKQHYGIIIHFLKVGWDGKSKFLPIILGVYPFVFLFYHRDGWKWIILGYQHVAVRVVLSREIEKKKSRERERKNKKKREREMKRWRGTVRRHQWENRWHSRKCGWLDRKTKFKRHPPPPFLLLSVFYSVSLFSCSLDD